MATPAGKAGKSNLGLSVAREAARPRPRKAPPGVEINLRYLINSILKEKRV
ncbi:hypothetical protein J27TS8_12660 [Robertmurraya siralis]|uniref:Uncharacterized protein n=1 Tax=Robertmurraya siralis TaxID=77777 RepID=A0A919WFZ5_9BACI|nr:hypothetical protein J27TS8_12660 [Robertmurraya siralis]